VVLTLVVFSLVPRPPSSSPLSLPDALPIYALALTSAAGKHNGLYWETAAGEPESPAGPMPAAAAAEGYGGQRANAPYHGYLYRIDRKSTRLNSSHHPISHPLSPFTKNNTSI